MAVLAQLEDSFSGSAEAVVFPKNPIRLAEPPDVMPACCSGPL